MDHSETERAYFAGFVDGEGAIMLRSCGRGNITLTLVIANTNLGALRGLQQLWGGYIHEEASQSVLHKPIYKLAFGGEVTGKILEEIGYG